MSIELEKPRPNKPTQWVQLAVVLLVVGMLGYVVVGFLMKFIWWILLILSVPVIIINYQTVLAALNYIKGLYSKNIYLGLVASLGSLLAITPFVGFLFLKTIWDFRNSDFIGGRKQLPSGQEQPPQG